MEDARLWMPERRALPRRRRICSSRVGSRPPAYPPRRPSDAQRADATTVGALGLLLWLLAVDARPGLRGLSRLGPRVPVRPEKVVTLRAIGGLLVFNLFIVGVGAGVLWGVRGWRWWTDFVRLIGVAYFLGLSALMIVTTLELVIGIPVGRHNAAERRRARRRRSRHRPSSRAHGAWSARPAGIFRGSRCSSRCS